MVICGSLKSPHEGVLRGRLHAVPVASNDLIVSSYANLAGRSERANTRCVTTDWAPAHDRTPGAGCGRRGSTTLTGAHGLTSISARGLDMPARTVDVAVVAVRARRGSGDPAEVLHPGAAFQLRHEHAAPTTFERLVAGWG